MHEKNMHKKKAEIIPMQMCTRQMGKTNIKRDVGTGNFCFFFK